MLSDATKAEIRDLIAQYPYPRSALGPSLHAVQRTLGWVPAEAAEEVADLLGMEATDVHAFLGFYTLYHQKPQGVYHLEICTSISCQLRAAERCADHLMAILGLNDWGQTTPNGLFTLDHTGCLGACGTAPVMSVRKRGEELPRYYEALTPTRLDEIIADLRRNVDKPLPSDGNWMGPAHYGGMEPKFLLRRIDRPYSHRIGTYVQDGGYQALRKALMAMTPEQVVEEIKTSGLRGRGGAGFPTGVKWGLLPPNVFPRYLICNADESEPGTFKDRMLLEYDPHQVLEGIIIAAYAIRAEKAFVFIRGEYGFAYARLRQAITEANTHRYLGRDILGSRFNLDVVIHRGAGAYICGEETALISSLEGQRANPRIKPPFPAVEGLYRKPTIINNVETLASVTHIINNGAPWYRTFGTLKNPGFRLFSVSGGVQRPGVYELPHGTTLRDLICTYAGGIVDDRPVKAVIPGGSSTPLLTADQLDTPLDIESVQAAGSLLGSAGVIVIPEGASIVDLIEHTVTFYGDESCGKCAPCRLGAQRILDILRSIRTGDAALEDLTTLETLANVLKASCLCPLGQSAPSPVQAALRAFRPEYEARVQT